MASSWRQTFLPCCSAGGWAGCSAPASSSRARPIPEPEDHAGFYACKDRSSPVWGANAWPDPEARRRWLLAQGAQPRPLRSVRPRPGGGDGKAEPGPLVQCAAAFTVSAPVETIKVADDEGGLRLDRWFRVHFPAVGYSYLQKLLRSGQVRVDSRRAQANLRLEAGQEVRVPQVVRGTASSRASPVPPLALSKADRDFIARLILYEDQHVLVLDKTFGIAVQGCTIAKRHIAGLLRGMAARL